MTTPRAPLPCRPPPRDAPAPVLGTEVDGDLELQRAPPLRPLRVVDDQERGDVHAEQPREVLVFVGVLKRPQRVQKLALPRQRSLGVRHELRIVARSSVECGEAMPDRVWGIAVVGVGSSCWTCTSDVDASHLVALQMRVVLNERSARCHSPRRPHARTHDKNRHTARSSKRMRQEGVVPGTARGAFRSKHSSGCRLLLRSRSVMDKNIRGAAPHRIAGYTRARTRASRRTCTEMAPACRCVCVPVHVRACAAVQQRGS